MSLSEPTETRTDRTSDAAEDTEQLKSLLTLTAESTLSYKRVTGSGDNNNSINRSSTISSTASPVPISPLHNELGFLEDLHPSPTHTAELMLTGGLPKNRRRPGTGSDSQCVMMTGTVTRGKSVGQPVEVQLDLTETELLRLTSRQAQTKGDHKFLCGRSQGPHVFLWSFLCMPVAMVISICTSFYNGSMTWYNLIIYFSEEKTIFHKVVLCPLIILSFPVTVGLTAFLISVVASVMQLSWSWRKWLAEIRDGEKGFCGWFCGTVGLPNCSPYQVVVLGESST